MTTYREARGRSLKDERNRRSLDHVRIHAYQSDDSDSPSYVVERHHTDGSVKNRHFDDHGKMVAHIHFATHPSNIQPYEEEDGHGQSADEDEGGKSGGLSG